MGRGMGAALMFLYEIIFPFHATHGERLREVGEPHRRAKLRAVQFLPWQFREVLQRTQQLQPEGASGFVKEWGV